jgi:hypothetical protein
LWIAVALVVLFLAVYLPVVQAEEEFLRLRFPEFADYAQRVPRFLPHWAPSGARQGQFSAQLYWKHREYNALLGTAAMMVALAAKLLWLR